MEREDAAVAKAKTKLIAMKVERRSEKANARAKEKEVSLEPRRVTGRSTEYGTTGWV